MISNIFRKFITFLSFYYFNNLDLIKKKDPIIISEINKKLNDSNIIKKNLKKTHNKFNEKLYNLILRGNFTHFLKYGFIQKMFFVHNRLFIYKELIQLKKGKWNLYKKLIKEDHVGDPIRYFLYPKSSGNKINHLYHLSILSEEFNINLKSIKKVFEFGSGYGCMARIFSKINSSISYVCFDTPYVNLLQYYYLKQNGLNVGFKKKNNFILMSNLDENKNYLNNLSNHLFIANWSLSETPIKFRKNFFKLIKKSNLFLICFQEKFEDVNNLKYFNDLKKKLSRNFKVKMIKNNFYKGNFFNSQNHYFLIGKKW
tara:strand:- start:352 stop:1290 length:939 start_codon:yes stop_codon:yes gene_type:complete